jgi:hypothetical protein
MFSASVGYQTYGPIILTQGENKSSMCASEKSRDDPALKDGRERERERETDRQTDRERERQTERERERERQTDRERERERN